MDRRHALIRMFFVLVATISTNLFAAVTVEKRVNIEPIIGEKLTIRRLSNPSSDGSKVAFTSFYNGSDALYIRTLSEPGAEVQVESALPQGSFESLALSDDGQSVAVLTSHAVNEEDDVNGYRDVYIFNTESGAYTRILSYQNTELDRGIDSIISIKSGEGFFFTSKSLGVVENDNSTDSKLYFYDFAQSSVDLVYDDLQSQTWIHDTSADGTVILLRKGSEFALLQRETGEVATIPNVYYSYSSQISLSGDGSRIAVFDRSHQSVSMYDVNGSIKNLVNIENAALFLDSLDDVNSSGSQVLLSTDYWCNGSYSSLSCNTVWLYDFSDERFVRVIGDIDKHFYFSADNQIIYSQDYNYLYATNVEALKSTSVSNASGGVSATTNLVGQIDIALPQSEEQFFAIYRTSESDPDSRELLTMTSGVEKFIDYPHTDEDFVYDIEPCNWYFVCTQSLEAAGSAIKPQNPRELSIDASKALSWEQIDLATKYNVYSIQNELVSQDTTSSNRYNFYSVYSNTQSLYVKVQACAFNLCADMPAWQSLTIPRGQLEINSELDVGSGSLILTWDMPLAAYFIVYSSNSGQQFVQRSKSSNNYFLDPSPSYGIEYRVVAFDYNDSEIARKHFVFSGNQIDVSTPYLRAEQFIEPGYVNLTWTNNSKHLTKIYRADTAFGQKQLIFSTQGERIGAYKDAIEPSHNSYYYWIEACSDNKCMRSETTKVSIDQFFHGEHIKLEADSIAGGHAIELGWDLPLNSLDSLYISRNGNILEQFQASTNKYIDTEVTPGREYSYQLFYSFGSSALRSNIVTITPKLYTASDAYISETPQLKPLSNYEFDSVEFVTTNKPTNAKFLRVFTVDIGGSKTFFGEYANERFRLYGMPIGSAVTVTAQWCNYNHCGPLSSEVTGTTSDTVSVPLKTAILDISKQSTNLGGVELSITWESSENAAYYVVGYSDAPYSEYIQGNISVPDTLSLTTIPYDRTRYYRVKACSAIGCSGWSDPVVYHSEYSSSRPLSYIYDIRTNGVDEISVGVSSEGYSRKVYVAASIGGEKTEVPVSNVNDRFIFTPSDMQTKYYFWVETCFNATQCELNERFKTFNPVLLPQTLPIPDLYTRQGSAPGRVDLINKNHSTETRLHIQYKTSDSAQYSSRESSAIATSFYLSDSDFAGTLINFRVKQCSLIDSSHCSEERTLSGLTLPEYTDTFSLDSSIYQSGTSTVLASYKGKSGVYNAASGIRSTQGLYYGKGFELDFDIYLEPKLQQQYGINCENLFSVRLGTSNDAGSELIRNVLSISRPEGGCGYQSSTSQLEIKLSQSENVETYAIKAETWHRIKVKREAGSDDVSLYIDGELELRAPVGERLDSHFEKLGVESNGMLTSNLAFSSLIDLTSDNPPEGYHYRYSNSNSVNFTPPAGVDVVSANIRVFKRSNIFEYISSKHLDYLR
ncbi:fibronectin type III domain-containing protein [Pseudoalteromonas sp. GB56]